MQLEEFIKFLQTSVAFFRSLFILAAVNTEVETLAMAVAAGDASTFVTLYLGYDALLPL